MKSKGTYLILRVKNKMPSESVPAKCSQNSTKMEILKITHKKLNLILMFIQGNTQLKKKFKRLNREVKVAYMFEHAFTFFTIINMHACCVSTGVSVMLDGQFLF